MRLGEEEAIKGNTVKQAGPLHSQSLTPLSNSGGHLSILPGDQMTVSVYQLPGGCSRGEGELPMGCRHLGRGAPWPACPCLDYVQMG